MSHQLHGKLYGNRLLVSTAELHQETATKHGFLLIDKPAGITSHDVVDRVRRLTGERRVGHAGTLDPFATGLLIVGVGRVATREMEKLVGLDKTYEAVFVLGASSDTDDRTGVISPAPIRSDLQPITYYLQPFLGDIQQIPPTYSAIKIGGKKMYEQARKGKPMEAKPRLVTIHSFEISPMGPIGPMMKLEAKISCSSGTYIRSIARDLGKALGGGGYALELRRTSIGPFSIQEAHPLTTLQTTDLIPVSELLSRLLTNTLPDANLLSV
ncbi:tRNA pseudouridine(55) synthase TruB [Candidatus Uhrbacteria bacterium]|nr:tRNA pseudouridine(55) synthase TruB [Candidatus Uhrbacteria bacterium]